MVRFRDGKPTGIYFSQHSDGSVYDWSDSELTIENERVRFLETCFSTACVLELTSKNSLSFIAQLALMQIGFRLGELDNVKPLYGNATDIAI